MDSTVFCVVQESNARFAPAIFPFESDKALKHKRTHIHRDMAGHGPKEFRQTKVQSQCLANANAFGSVASLSLMMCWHHLHLEMTTERTKIRIKNEIETEMGMGNV